MQLRRFYFILMSAIVLLALSACGGGAGGSGSSGVPNVAEDSIPQDQFDDTPIIPQGLLSNTPSSIPHLPSNIEVYLNNGQLTSPSSSLVLTVPDGYNVSSDIGSFNILPQDARAIYQTAAQMTECQAEDPIDLVLAETCIYYQQYYLYQDQLPTSLNNLLNAKHYVNTVGRNDPFTHYFGPETFSNNNSNLIGEQASIGLQIDTSENNLKIQKVSPLSRAWFDGLQAEDIIIAINNESIAGLPVKEALEKLPSLESESVSITVQRNEQQITIDTAAEEHFGKLVGQNEDIAYLRVKQFTTKTGSYMQADFESLETQGNIQKVILDLRNDLGGSLLGSLDLVDYLIDKDEPEKTNLILSAEDWTGQTLEFYLGDYLSAKIGDFSKNNFVVLINDKSASASEVTTAALMDYEVATIIGSQSFGKGVSQSVLELRDHSGIWITSHHLLSPTGTNYHGVGLEPDEKINLDLNQATPESDSQLLAAIQFLNTGNINSHLLAKNSRETNRFATPIDPILDQNQEIVY